MQHLSSKHQIILIGCDDPNFSSLLRSSIGDAANLLLDQTAACNSVLMRNTGSVALVGYDLRWHYTWNGKPHVQDTVRDSVRGLLDAGKAKYPNNMAQSIKVLEPQGIRLSSIVGDIWGPDLGASGGDSERTEAVKRAVSAIGRSVATIGPERPTVSLDLALFEDGVAIGDNASEHLDVVRAYVDAKQDLVEECLALLKEGTPDASLTQRLNRYVAAPASGQTVFSYHHSFYHADFASEFLAIFAKFGRARFKSYLEFEHYSSRPHLQSLTKEDH